MALVWFDSQHRAQVHLDTLWFRLIENTNEAY